MSDACGANQVNATPLGVKAATLGPSAVSGPKETT
jgi:hypothetical protein